MWAGEDAPYHHNHEGIAADGGGGGQPGVGLRSHRVPYTQGQSVDSSSIPEAGLSFFALDSS